VAEIGVAGNGAAPGVDLVVPNIAEFNLRNAALRLGPAAERAAVRLGTHMADTAVLWSAGERVLALPPGVDRAWLGDLHRALHLAVPPVVSPAGRTGLLTEDLLRDGRALAALRDALAGRGPVRLLSWGATPGLFRLAGVLAGWGLDVALDGPAEPDYWASLYLDSKMSCLDLARELPGVRVPPGVTVGSLPELRGAVAAMLRAHRRVIVRGMYGVGGEGSAVVRFGGPALDALWTALQRDEFLRAYPLTVQRYVPHAPGVGCPAVDLYVTADGASREVVSAMTVDGHRFRSVVVGPDALPPAEAARCLRVARAVAAAAADLGYRGWMCVDYVLGADGELYLTEVNARRSGAMHAIGLLNHLGGDLTACAFDTAAAGDSRRASYPDTVRPVFQALWDRGLCAYPTAPRGLAFPEPTVGVLAAAATAAEAQRLVTGALSAIRAVPAGRGSP
jgi:hypothetical protein